MMKRFFRRLIAASLGLLSTLTCAAGIMYVHSDPASAETLVPPTSGTVRYEAEDATIEDESGICIVDAREGVFDDASGKAAVNNIHATAQVAFTVNVSAAGRYIMTVGYCCGRASGETLTAVTADGEEYPIFLPQNCTNWMEYSSVSLEIELPAGEQTLRIGEGTSGSRLDYIDIGTIDFDKYEAETAALVGCKADGIISSADRLSAFPNASGNSAVVDINYSTSRINFAVNVPEDGKYLLTVGYCTTGAATLVVTSEENFSWLIDGQKTCGDWTRYAVTTLEISLRAGEQVLSVRKGLSYVRLDYIGLKKSGEYEASAVSVPDGYTRYEAEDLVEVRGDVSSANSTTASGHLYIGGTAPVDPGLTFPVAAEKDGVYRFRLGYGLAAGESVTIQVVVDGVTAASLTADQGAGTYTFDTDRVVTADVYLPAGDHTVVFRAAESGPRFDFVDVRSIKLTAPAMTTGAAVRMNADLTNSGLRFETVYERSFIETLNGEIAREDGMISAVSYGTLIVPLDYLADGTQPDMEAIAEAGKKYLDIASTGFLEQEQQGDTLRYWGSIIDILPQNYAQDFVGLGYMKLTLSDGSTQYIYAEYDETNARSVYEVASGAYNDRSGTQTERYAYLTAEGDYSPYTDAQRVILEAYINVVNTTDGEI